jgi:hypothetical protein
MDADGRPGRVIEVQHRGRPIGAYVVGTDTVTFRPVVDVTRLVTTGVAAVVLAAAITAVAAGMRRPPAIGTVTMGPGGWVSLKRTAAPPLRATDGRPWWARALRARRLVVES